MSNDELFLSEPRSFGLRNLGNTCYVNSTIQLLQSCDMLQHLMLSKKFLEYVKTNKIKKLISLKKKNGDTSKYINRDVIIEEINNTLSIMYYKFIYKLTKNPGITFCVPVKFLDRLQKLIELVRGYNQNDVSEFLTFFLSQLDSEMKIKSTISRNNLIQDEHMELFKEYKNILNQIKKYNSEKEKYDKYINILMNNKKKHDRSLIYIFEFSNYWDNFCNGMSNGEPNYSPLTNIFSYNTYIENTCNNCDNYSITFDIHYIMDIPVPEINEFVNIYDLIKNEYYDKIEKLCQESDSSFSCSICKKKTEAQRKIRLWDLPERLIIQLKLFNHYYNKEQNESVSKKIHTPVNYPLILDLNNCVSEMNPINKENQYVYRLCGYIKHYGSYDGGHYVAVTKNWDNEYYLYNDSEPPVHVDKKSVINDDPYILMYERIATSATHESDN